MYKIILSKKAQKHKPLLKQANLGDKTKLLLDVISKNPFQTPPSYEKLTGDLSGAYSRRINRQHRLVYTVNEELKEVFILAMWTHYE